MDDAFKFIKKSGGITTESNYPYRAVNGTCNSIKVNSSWFTPNRIELIGMIHFIILLILMQYLICQHCPNTGNYPSTKLRTEVNLKFNISDELAI